MDPVYLFSFWLALIRVNSCPQWRILSFFFFFFFFFLTDFFFFLFFVFFFFFFFFFLPDWVFVCLFVCLFCGLGFLQHVIRRSKFWKLRFPVLIISRRLKTNIFEDHGITVSVISHRRKNAIELSGLFFKIYKISEDFFFFLSRSLFFCDLRSEFGRYV